MDQLIQQVTQRTGISEQQAREAIETVVGYFKEHLPAPIAAQVDGVIKGQGGNPNDATQQVQDMLGKAGGFFNKQ